MAKREYPDPAELYEQLHYDELQEHRDYDEYLQSWEDYQDYEDYDQQTYDDRDYFSSVPMEECRHCNILVSSRAMRACELYKTCPCGYMEETKDG